MNSTNKTYSQLLIEKSEARGMLEISITIAQNLIGKITNSEIAEVTGLSLTQVEELATSPRSLP